MATPQAQTFFGKRGDTPLSSGTQVLTYKDAYQAFLIGLNRAAGRSDDSDVYGIIFDEIDVIAAAQNMCCVLEQRAGIYPNIPSDLERDLAEAIRLTVEYVGNDMLPAQEGWSWFDALKRYDPNMVRPFVEKPIHFPKAKD